METLVTAVSKREANAFRCYFSDETLSGTRCLRFYRLRKEVHPTMMMRRNQSNNYLHGIGLLLPLLVACMFQGYVRNGVMVSAFIYKQSSSSITVLNRNSNNGNIIYSATRLRVSENSNNWDDNMNKLKSIQEEIKNADIMEALIVEESASLVPIYLRGQGNLRMENPTSTKRSDSTLPVLVLSQEKEQETSSSTAATIQSLLLPLTNRNQLKLVSFAKSNKPLSKSVMLGLNSLLVNRDGALFDNLPWSTWSIDPQRRNYDAANNPIDAKFHLGKRDAYNRFMGKDWQGRSLAIGNLALRLKYLLEETDEIQKEDAKKKQRTGEDEQQQEEENEVESSLELTKRILQLQIREL